VTDVVCWDNLNSQLGSGGEAPTFERPNDRLMNMFLLKKMCTYIFSKSHNAIWVDVLNAMNSIRMDVDLLYVRGLPQTDETRHLTYSIWVVQLVLPRSEKSRLVVSDVH
jgi:hypothetical protein